jgi:FdrA protein
MNSSFKIFKNLYRDSVSLMQISARICKLDGIERAAVLMGTETNREQLADAGFGSDIDAGPNDLIVAVRGNDDVCIRALEEATEQLSARVDSSADGVVRKQALTSLQMAAEQSSEANMALISVPGDYAAAEAIKALRLGMHVMLFSDNVSLAQERSIKMLARDNDLIVMGPDCGTAIVNGLPLGFANVVRRGAVGLVAASGTGLQEVTCRIHQLGEGVSQALGTGGHDLHEEIGGISMLYGLDALIADKDTRVIVLVSKPPAPSVAKQILARARAAGKPVVIHFLGAQPADIEGQGVVAAPTLADAGNVAVALLRGDAVPASEAVLGVAEQDMLDAHAAKLPARRRFVRGVFAGGTFCYESQLLCQKQGIRGSSNTPVKGNESLTDVWTSIGHTVVDLGDDVFTRGRPHPMIDPTLRNERIVAELQQPETAVVLFDVVLGYGAADAPATELAALLRETLSPDDGTGSPLLIAHVCGTDADPQDREAQISALRNAGVLVAGCNAQAASWAAYVASLQMNK